MEFKSNPLRQRVPISRDDSLNTSLAAAGSRAPELPGLLPADARYYRSRRAMQFGIGGSSG
jgi:hypothetical protein